MAAPLEFLAQRDMILDFAVERNDRIAIGGDNRLVTAAQVDNLQPHGTKRHVV
jgi:hypothetical protein